MHPAIHYHLMQARTADLHDHARRAALARAVRLGRRARWHQPAHFTLALPAFAARRVPSLPGARSPRPAQ